MFPTLNFPWCPPTNPYVCNGNQGQQGFGQAQGQNAQTMWTNIPAVCPTLPSGSYPSIDIQCGQGQQGFGQAQGQNYQTLPTFFNIVCRTGIGTCSDYNGNQAQGQNYQTLPTFFNIVCRTGIGSCSDYNGNQVQKGLPTIPIVGCLVTKIPLVC